MMTLNPEVLRCDTDVQPRLALSDAHIREYAALLQEGHQLGTIVVFQDGSDYYLADGFHRVAAATRIGLEALPAEIHVGTKREALLYARGANKHGKPLSNPDKRRVVLHMLEDTEWGQWSDREIARHCGVGHALVSRLRRSLSPRDSDTAPRTYRTKQGTVTTMETRALGKRAALDVPGDAATLRDSHPAEGSPDTAKKPAGNPVREAVTQVRQGHTMGLPTPPAADAVSDAVARRVTPVAPDDSIPEGHAKETETAHAAFPTRLSHLLDALAALASFPDLEQLLLDIPQDYYDRIDQYLDTALATLSRLQTFRRAHRHDAIEGRMQPRASKGVKPPPTGKTRRKPKRARKHAAPKVKIRQPAETAPAATRTAPSQPAMILAAIRTAPQPLTMEDLRQLPSVDGTRLKRNVTRLLEQRKMQETPTGYVAPS